MLPLLHCRIQNDKQLYIYLVPFITSYFADLVSVAAFKLF